MNPTFCQTSVNIIFSTDSTFTAYLPGTYYVTATDECGGHYSDTINISLAPAVPFDLGPDKEICTNDIITLKAPAGFSDYKWSPNYAIDTAYGPTVQLWPTVDTIYTVTAVKDSGCSVLDSIRIKVHPLRKINLGIDTSFCQGGSIILNAGTNFNSYQWNTGSTNQSITASLAGSYSIVAVDSNGCVSKDTLSVLNIYPNPIINLGNDRNICTNDSVLLNAGSGFQSYFWQDNSSSQTFTVHTTGQYWVHVKNNQNCIAGDTINIINLVPNPVINLGPDTSFCKGQSILLAPGNGFISYTWQDNSHAQSFAASLQGQYSVLVKDANNCSASDTLNIMALYTVPVVNIGKDTFLCRGRSITLNAGSGFAGYLWQDNSTSQFFTASQKGSYFVKVTNNAGCSTIDTFRVTNLVNLPANFVSSSYPLCENVSLFIKPVGSFSSFLWSNGTMLDSILISAPGNYWLTATHAYGCSAKESFEVIPKNCITALYFPNSFSPNNDNLNESITGMVVVYLNRRISTMGGMGRSTTFIKIQGLCLGLQL